MVLLKNILGTVIKKLWFKLYLLTFFLTQYYGNGERRYNLKFYL
jgi:hypothetical protein